MGAGDDTFVWNPGDGSDTVEGQDGSDTMLFNGANVAEHVDLSANGNRLRFFRDVANITMDTAGVEQVDFNALGGADAITVGDVSRTALDTLNLDLGANDSQADQVTVDGTDRNDQITVTGANGAASVTGLPETVNVANAEPANDTLAVNALGGNDTVNASALATVFKQLAVDGGDGNDTIAGRPGADVLVGGDGNDSIDGNQGERRRVARCGQRHLRLRIRATAATPLKARTSTDSMVFNGSNANENIDLSANGPRLRLFRDVGNIIMDTNGVEHVAVNAIGGADTVVTNDLTGTGVTAVAVDLGSNGAATARRITSSSTARADRTRSRSQGATAPRPRPAWPRR